MGDEVRDFYNRYGEREWYRLEEDACSRITFVLHMDFIKPHLREGIKTLDAGCGAGRYSVEFARMGCDVTLFDISDEQLRIAKTKLAERDLERQVSGYIQGDIRDLSVFPDQSFDVVVCYGAPLNYVLEGRERAISEFHRVLKDGGILALSANSKWGSFKSILGRNIKGFFNRPGYWYIDSIITSGDWPKHEKVDHPPRHFFEARELRELMESAQFRDIVLGASPCILHGSRLQAVEICGDETAYQTLLDIELRVYQKPSMVDSGEYLMAKGRK
jgi:ubiquinone/menaquinone biosynthesis C-methylase UbiE